MAARSLKEAFEVDGDWWLPEMPQQSVAGRIRYSPEKAELFLREPLTPWLQCAGGPLRFDDFRKDYSTVHGLTDHGHAVTVLKALRMGIRTNVGPHGSSQSERLLSSWVLVGYHGTAQDTYKKARFRIPGLHLWLGVPLIHQRFEDVEGAGSVPTFRVLSPALPHAAIGSIGATVTWEVCHTRTADNYGLEVEAAAWLGIAADQPKLLEWFLEQQAALTALLAILADAPMAPDAIEVFRPDEKDAIDLLLVMREPTCCPYQSDFEFAMLRAGLEADLTVVLERWFNLYPKVKMPSQLALSIIGSKALWPHIEFLSLMQALEGLHRGVREGTYMPDKEYAAVKEVLGRAIPAGLSDSHKAALKSKIRYGNQISLRKRLGELLDDLGEELRATLLGSAGSVPQSWVDTRNYFTHWDETLTLNTLDGERMHRACVRMRQLLRVLYMKLVGVPERALILSLRNPSESSQYLMQLNAREQTSQGAL